MICSPIRRAERLTDLTTDETADLFNLAKRVQKMVEAHHGANSSSYGIQDGDDAGRTVVVRIFHFTSHV